MTNGLHESNSDQLHAFSLTLLRILESSYSLDEIRTLCFELDVEFENLEGETKQGKVRELILWGKRNNKLVEIKGAILQKRPDLDLTVEYSPERTQQLQDSIMTGASQKIQGSFAEFTQQVDAYTNEFNLLHERMKEWKEVHNYLQDLQNHFAPCRGYIYTFGSLGRLESEMQEQEKLLYTIEVEWRPCKRVLRRLEEFATQILVIGEAYIPDSPEGPVWLFAPKRAAKKIDEALFNQNLLALRESLSEFGDETDQHLYLADKALLNTANEIMSLRRPNISSA